MFCTNCGFENPALHRFCGMCGTPLPQRPTTPPHEESAAGLTRQPVEVPQASSSTAANLSRTNLPAATQTQETQPSATAASSYFSQAERAESLEQFIAGFHYTPPAEEDEVTMTGAKPTLDSAAKYEPAAPISLSEEALVAEPLPKTTESLHPPVIAADTVPPLESVAEQPPLVATEPPPFATKGIKDQAPERSRFLDFSEPAKEAPPATAAPSIGGPSFLGLSDIPATPAYVADDAAGRESHWRAWTVLIVIVAFAGLGFLKWRAEKNQSSNGPIGIMKMQINRLKGKKGTVITPPPSEAAKETAEPGTTSQPAASGPQMQVAPQQKPQSASPQPDNNRGTPEKPANPGAALNAAPAKTQSPSTEASSLAGSTGGQKPQTAPKAESANSTSANNSPNSMAQSAHTAESKTEKPVKTTPGAEELAKAANASDAAAASAWLWKSVAKGNPEAPIKLANMYIKGDGVPQSCEQAMVLLRSAAAEENAAARSRLGSLYATGTCVPRNRVRAYQYMNQALQVNPNAIWAKDFWQQLWTQMTPEERQQTQKAQ